RLRRLAADARVQRHAARRRRDARRRVHPLPRPQLEDVEQEDEDLRRALRLAVRPRRAGGVGRSDREARRGGARGVRHVQQQPRRLRAAQRARVARAARRDRHLCDRRRRARAGERDALLMRLLSVVHGEEVRGEAFDDVARDEGHEVEEWWIVSDAEPPRALGDYDAVIVYGGAMNVDQEDEHPWLRREDEVVRTLPGCRGGQLLAKAAGAHVGPSPEPEFGFTPVTLSAAAADDPLFGGLPRELEVFNAHGYAFHVPDDGVELARSAVCAQAFRLGDGAWGVQFHPDVRAQQVPRWLTDDPV